MTGESKNISIGARGEESAVSFLSEKGFEILARNFRFGRAGEIDIVARKGCLIAFVEVKKRTGDIYGGALYSISETKKRKIRNTAKYFIAKNSIYDSAEYMYRFDMISIKNDEIEWIEDIFR